MLLQLKQRGYSRDPRRTGLGIDKNFDYLIQVNPIDKRDDGFSLEVNLQILQCLPIYEINRINLR